MKTRALAIALMGTVSLLGCDDDKPAANNGNNAATNNANNTNNGATNNGEVECELSDDCDQGATNERGSCQQGQCVYLCSRGYDDRDDQPGCEFVCQSVENVCNEVDDDCDGEVNEQPPVPNPPKGVCGDAEPFCDGSRYVNGGLELFETISSFRQSGLEDFLCDGLDNDCDGFVDDVCCRGTERPEPIVLSSVTDAKLPQVVRTTTGGIVPPKGLFLTAWAEGNETVTQLVQGNGWTVNPSQTYPNDAEYNETQSLDIALDETTVFMALGGVDAPATKSRIYLHEMKVNQAATTTAIFDTADDSARNVTVAFSDTHVCVAWTWLGTDPTTPWQISLSCALKENTPALADMANHVTVAEAAAAAPLYPELAGGQTEIALAFAQPGSGGTELVVLTHDGTSLGAATTTAAGPAGDPEPVSMWHFEDTTNYVIAHTTNATERTTDVVGFDSASGFTQTLSYPGGAPSVGAASGIQVTSADIDRDDTTDGFYVSWHNGTAVRGAARHLDQLAAGTNPEVTEVHGLQEGADIGYVRIAGARRILGIVFDRPNEGVFFVPGTLQGAAVCVPDDIDF